MNILDKKLIKRILLLTGISFGVYLIFKYMLPLVIPFIFSIVLSKCLYPAAIRLNSVFKLPYRISVVVSVLFFSALVCFLSGVIMYTAFSQVRVFVANFPFYRTGLINHIEKLCSQCDGWFGMPGGRMYEMFQLGTDYLGENWFEKFMPFVTERAWGACTLVFSGVVVFIFFLVGTALIMEEYSMVMKDIKNSYILKKTKPLFKSLKETLAAYFKAQLVIVGIVATVCSAGLFFLNNSYAVFIGILIALIDAFPLVGSGIVLVPWALINIVRGDFVSAAVLFAVYVICMLTREILEPKIMGQQTGLRPIYTFISFYVGIRLFGIVGVILGPIGIVIIKNIYLNTLYFNELS